jgi:hypothetical protein
MRDPGNPGAPGDTVVAGDSVTTAVTSSTLDRYLALEQDLQAFWHAHQDLADSARAQTRSRPLFLGPPLNLTLPVKPIDYVSVAAKTPGIKALFTKHHFPIAQYKPAYIAAWKAVYAAEMNQALQTPIDETTREGKNAVFAREHREALTAVGFKMNASFH